MSQKKTEQQQAQQQIQHRAVCQFCSKPDDSIQVVCEARCLLCSRCQLIPGIRRLLVENTVFQEDTVTSTGKVNGNAISGNCPICFSPLAASMMSIIQSYRDALKAQTEDQLLGKSTIERKLEELCLTIPNFLKKFKITYENNQENRLQLATQSYNVDLDAEIDQMLNNRHLTMGQNLQNSNVNNNNNNNNNYTNNNNSSNLGKGLKANNNNNLGEQSGIPTASKVNITIVLEFILDCFQAQWQSMVKNGNESMLAIMMKQSNKKKYSQKTNDYKTKGLIDFFLSNYGYEMPELILFSHMIGLQPKFTNKISAAWSQVATCILVASCFDQCLKNNELFNELTVSSIGISEFRMKLGKCFQMVSLTNNSLNNPALNQLNHSNTKVISLRKALKIIQFLLNIHQPYWIMTPLMASCVEYESRFPWSEESISKLINVLFYVALTENNLWKKGVNLFPVYSEANNSGIKISSVPIPSFSNNLPVTTETFVTSTNQDRPETEAPNSRTTFERQRTYSNGNLPVRSHSALARTQSVGSNADGSRPPKSSRKSSIMSTASGAIGQALKDINIYQPGTRLELLRLLHPVLDKFWFESNEKYKIPKPRPSTAAYSNDFMPRKKSFSQSSAVLEYLSDIAINLFLKDEKSYVPLTIDEGITLLEQHSNLYIPINDFLYVVMLSWNREYKLVQTYLEKSQLSKLRRPAITANYPVIMEMRQKEQERISQLPTSQADSLLTKDSWGEKG